MKNQGRSAGFPPPLTISDPKLLMGLRCTVANCTAQSIVAVADERVFWKRYCRQHLPADRPGICKSCGCTTERACLGGCTWITPTLCTACAEGS